MSIHNVLLSVNPLSTLLSTALALTHPRWLFVLPVILGLMGTAAEGECLILLLPVVDRAPVSACKSMTTYHAQLWPRYSFRQIRFQAIQSWALMSLGVSGGNLAELLWLRYRVFLRHHTLVAWAWTHPEQDRESGGSLVQAFQETDGRVSSARAGSPAGDGAGTKTAPYGKQLTQTLTRT